jgi:uncharacterized membrane protein SpoIIM required for sporulation
MKESRFIAQNKQKWQEAETLLDSESKDPEKLGNLFVQVVDDLSYSRTYYPNRSVRVYLNKIARQFFSIIYEQKKEKHNSFKLFWLDELPQIMLFSRTEMLVSLCVFLLTIAIGVFSSMNDPQFVNSILGDKYVAMTEKNISSGDPMAVYKESQQMDMFLQITFNNLMVAFRTYVLGIFLGIGTLGSLVFHGVMVGCFQYFFIRQGLFIDSASTIWLHGTLEISSIILAGGAGLTLGRGLIFPGTYSRLESVQISGIRSLKIMLGITPIFVLAAIIESFLTRYTETPLFLKLALILFSALFIIGYFVVYPWMKSRSGFLVPLKDLRLQPSSKELVNFTRVKNNADLLKDTFQFYTRYSTSILPWIFTVSLVVAGASLFVEKEPNLIINEMWWVALFEDMVFVLNMPSPIFIGVNGLATGLIFYRTMMLIDADSKKIKPTIQLMPLIQAVIIASVIYGAIYFGVLGILIILFAWGILVFAAFVQVTEKIGLPRALARSWDLFGQNKTHGMSLQFVVLLFCFTFLLVLSAPLLFMNISVLKWNFVDTDIWSQKLIQFIEAFVKAFSFHLLLPLAAASLSYLYFSQREAMTATHLRETIAKMGTRISKSSKR